MDATELLKKDHESVRQLFAEFESAESDDSKLDAYEDLRQQLLIHARVEEEIFYPPKIGRGGCLISNRQQAETAEPRCNCRVLAAPKEVSSPKKTAGALSSFKFSEERGAEVNVLSPTAIAEAHCEAGL
jgi:hypothetical protein